MRTRAILSLIAAGCCALASCTTDFDRFQFVGTDQQSSSAQDAGGEGDGDGDGDGGDASTSDASGHMSSDASGDANDGGAPMTDLDAAFNFCRTAFERFPVVRGLETLVAESDDIVLSVGLGELVTKTEQGDEDGDFLYNAHIDVNGDEALDVLRYVTDDEPGLAYEWSETTELNMMVVLNEPSNSATYLCALGNEMFFGCNVIVSCEQTSSSAGPPRCFPLPQMPVLCGFCALARPDGTETWQCESTSSFSFSF